MDVSTPAGKQRNVFFTCATGGPFGSSSLQQEIGLGNADAINEIEVIFPDGKQQAVIYKGAECNHAYKIVQGQSGLIARTLKPVTFKKAN